MRQVVVLAGVRSGLVSATWLAVELRDGFGSQLMVFSGIKKHRTTRIHKLRQSTLTALQGDLFEDARLAVLEGLSSCIPMISFQTFLDYLGPPQPDFDLNATMQSLKLGSDPILISSNQWSKFPRL